MITTNIKHHIDVNSVYWSAAFYQALSCIIVNKMGVREALWRYLSGKVSEKDFRSEVLRRYKVVPSRIVQAYRRILPKRTTSGYVYSVFLTTQVHATDVVVNKHHRQDVMLFSRLIDIYIPALGVYGLEAVSGSLLKPDLYYVKAHDGREYTLRITKTYRSTGSVIDVILFRDDGRVVYDPDARLVVQCEYLAVTARVHKPYGINSQQHIIDNTDPIRGLIDHRETALSPHQRKFDPEIDDDCVLVSRIETTIRDNIVPDQTVTVYDGQCVEIPVVVNEAFEFVVEYRDTWDESVYDTVYKLMASPHGNTIRQQTHDALKHLFTGHFNIAFNVTLDKLHAVQQEPISRPQMWVEHP